MLLATLIPYSEISTLLLALLVLSGLVFLFWGGDWLTTGGSSLAFILKINPVVIGLTVVAIATSMPELMTVLFSAASGKADLAIGNIIGSNICNIGLILGLAALIQPVETPEQLIRTEMPFLLATTLLFSLFSFGGIHSLEGTILFITIAGYTFYLMRLSSNGAIKKEMEYTSPIHHRVNSISKCIAFIGLGGIFLALGAELLVNSSATLAHRLGVSDVLIGLTLLAIGTSLPELATSIAAAAKKQPDLCAGNIVGSNLFNMLFIGGGVSIFFPLRINESLFFFEYPAMLLLTGLLWLIFTTGRRVSRAEGGFLVALYSLVIWLSSLLQTGKLEWSL